MFRRNVGGVDRVARVILGAILLAAGLAMLAAQTNYGSTVTIIGVLVLMSGISGSCGLYIPFGISTAHPQAERFKRICCGVAAGERPAACREPGPGETPPAGQDHASAVR